MIRIGHGFDVHRTAPSLPLILGGVNIDVDFGLIAHSDGDVVLHAICDALLGAAALGDIGQHFPDSDPQFSGIDSRMLLRHVVELVFSKGYLVNNIDVTIVAQKPKLAACIPTMVQNIAVDLNVQPEQVNVKATTTESLGYTGRSEGIACHAVILINSRD